VKIVYKRKFAENDTFQKRKELQKIRKINKNNLNFSFLEIDLIRFSFLGNNSDQKYFYMLENLENILRAPEIAKNRDFQLKFQEIFRKY